MKTVNSNEKDFYHSLIPGALRCTTSLVTHPLEQVKVRLQAHRGTEQIKWNNFFRFMIGDIKRSERIYSVKTIMHFYKGYPATLFSIAAKMIYKYPLLIHGPSLIQQYTDKFLSVYDKIAFGKFLSVYDKIALGTVLDSIGHTRNNRHPILYQVALTPFVLLVDTILQAPQRRIKYIAMTESLGTSGQSTTWQTSKFLFKSKKDGLGFWYGSRAYAIKHGIGQASLLLTDAIIREQFLANGYKPNIHNPWYIIATGFNGIFITVITTPLDVVMTRIGSRTRVHESQSYLRTMINIQKSEGLKGLWRGTFLRVVPRTITVMYTSMAISWGRGY